MAPRLTPPALFPNPYDDDFVECPKIRPTRRSTGPRLMHQVRFSHAGDDPVELPDTDLMNIGVEHIETLQSNLPDMTLLRTVSAKHVLQNVGFAFRTSTGSLCVTCQDHSKSKPGAQIDDFISHCWCSGRWRKTSVLLLIYNGHAAAIISGGASVMLSLLQTDLLGFLPSAKITIVVHLCGKEHTTSIGTLSAFVTPIVFVVVLLSWQRIRSVCLQSPRLFVDKFCVDQVNETRKTQAILGLAGFLKHSQRLVVCWSPHYFSRLWTVYEIASWHHVKGSMKDVLLQPTAQSFTILSLLLLFALLVFSFRLCQIFFPSASLYSSLSLAVVIGSVFCFQMLEQIRDAGALEDQLAEFSVRQAQCFCCSNHHTMPDTGRPIRCDRELVYQKIAERYLTMHEREASVLETPWAQAAISDQSGEWQEEKKRLDTYLSGDYDLQELAKSKLLQAAALNEFDGFVRNDFAPTVITKLLWTGLSYRQVLYATMPYWWHIGDLLHVMSDAAKRDVFSWFLLENCVKALLAGPVCFVLLHKLLYFMDQQTKRNPLKRHQSTALHLCAISVTFALAWIPTRVLNGWLKQRPPFIAFSVVLLLLNLCFYTNLHSRCAGLGNTF